MKGGEVASRVVVPVYHTGQGQDERARTRPQHLLRGLDSVWSLALNPHRERQHLQWGRLTVGRAEETGTVWATPLEHRLPALAMNVAALRAPRGAQQVSAALCSARTQATRSCWGA